MLADPCKTPVVLESDVASESSSSSTVASKSSAGLEQFVSFAFPSFPTLLSGRRNASGGATSISGEKRSADSDGFFYSDNYEEDTGKTTGLLGSWWGIKRQKCSPANEDDVATLEEEEKSSQEIVAPPGPSQLMQLPEDLLNHCFSFLCPAEDRMAVSLTCEKFREMLNTDRMLRLTDLFGCPSTGKRCIILEDDTKESALERMAPYLAAGSTDAMYL